MFCHFCGAEVPKGASFCSNCGHKFLEGAAETKMDSRVLVQAKCTSCGAGLEVNPAKETAICPFCGEAYIVEKAINNYNISQAQNVTINGGSICIKNGPDVCDLLKRADEFFEVANYQKAKEYYEKVLDCEFDNEKARTKIDILSTVYFTSGSLQLTALGLEFIEKETKQIMLISCNDIIGMGTREEDKKRRQWCVLRGIAHLPLLTLNGILY